MAGLPQMRGGHLAHRPVADHDDVVVVHLVGSLRWEPEQLRSGPIRVADDCPYAGQCSITNSIDPPRLGVKHDKRDSDRAMAPHHVHLADETPRNSYPRFEHTTGADMVDRNTDSDFVEALARGLSVIRAFEAGDEPMTLVEIAALTGLPRPTARRMLLTLESLGNVRTVKNAFTLTPRVLELGFTYVQASGLWGVARPHMERLVEKTHESSSIAQLDGSDIVYVARVAVPKIIALAVEVGTRFPAAETSLGKVIMSGMTAEGWTRSSHSPAAPASRPASSWTARNWTPPSPTSASRDGLSRMASWRPASDPSPPLCAIETVESSRR